MGVWLYEVPRMQPLNLVVSSRSAWKKEIIHSCQHFADISNLLCKYLLPWLLFGYVLWCFLLLKFWPCKCIILTFLLSMDDVNIASTSDWNEISSFGFGRWQRPFPLKMFVGKSRFWKLYQGTIISSNSMMHVRTPSMSTLSWSMFFCGLLYVTL